MGHHRLLPPHSDHPFPLKVDEVENTIARRAYELFASRGFTDGHDLDDWFLAQSELFGQMPVSVTETENEVTVRAGLPGFTEKDIEIRVEPRRLFIGGMHEEKSENKKKARRSTASTPTKYFAPSIFLPMLTWTRVRRRSAKETSRSR